MTRRATATTGAAPPDRQRTWSRPDWQVVALSVVLGAATVFFDGALLLVNGMPSLGRQGRWRVSGAVGDVLLD